jgi:putative transposase
MPVLHNAARTRLEEIAAEVIEEKDASLRRIRLLSSCVELVVEADPQLGIHRLVKAIKSRSAGALRTEFPELRSRIPSLWTNSYLVTTLGGELPEQAIGHYINSQPKR